MNNSFAKDDYISAREAFIQCQGKIDDNVGSYLLRQRKAEFTELVRLVIKNELSELDQKIVKLKWYENYSNKEIAANLGLDISTVSRHIEKINSTVYEKLKYAIGYRYGKSFCNMSKTIIKSGEVYSCTIEPESISERVRLLRLKQSLSDFEVEKLTGIKRARLSEIEKSAGSMTMPELKKLCMFYRCTSDYILFGH